MKGLGGSGFRVQALFGSLPGLGFRVSTARRVRPPKP